MVMSKVKMFLVILNGKVFIDVIAEPKLLREKKQE